MRSGQLVSTLQSGGEIKCWVFGKMNKKSRSEGSAESGSDEEVRYTGEAMERCD